MPVKKELRDYFIPHGGNGYKPHSLQRAAVAGMTFLVLLTFTISNLSSFVWTASDWLVSTILPSVVVEETNVERSQAALTTLRRNPILDEAARQKAEHMARNEYFSHYSPDGVSPWYWFNEVSYNFAHAGENLAIHFTDSSAVVDAWMNSPSHRANIMSGKFQEIGVAAVEGSYEGFSTVYVVQLFGTPAASPVAIVEQEQPLVPQPEEVPLLAQQDTTAPSTQLESVAGAEQENTQPAEEIAVLSEEVVATASAPVVAAAEETELVADTATAPESGVEEVVITDDSVIVYSGQLSTSSGAAPASITPANIAGTTQYTAGVFSILTKPTKILQIAYVAIGGFVVLALILSIVIEVRKQHPVQIAYGVLLLLLMYGLYNLHTTLTGGALVV